jgi:RhtB (resistance to homoserine/threonine) family protein
VRVSWATYGTFVAFAAIVVIAPGPDFTVVLKNSLAHGRSAGFFTSFGVTTSCLVQGTLAAFGVGVIIARSQPLFLAIRWAGVAYLCYLGVQALLAARRGDGANAAQRASAPARRPRVAAWRQGFLSNITNPKVLAFYLSVLPQFIGRTGTPTIDALALAYTHAVLGILWLAAMVTFLHRMRAWIQRRRVRRTLDAVTGTALIGFASALAVESR